MKRFIIFSILLTLVAFPVEAQVRRSNNKKTESVQKEENKGKNRVAPQKEARQKKQRNKTTNKNRVKTSKTRQKPSAKIEKTIEEPVFGQKKRVANMDIKYRRSSWYNILIQHPEQDYCDEIQYVYHSRPQSDKFNDHSLSIVAVTAEGIDAIPSTSITQFLSSNDIAKRLVAKWFDRDKLTGFCDVDLITSRGEQNATAGDVEISKMSTRKDAMFIDTGVDLISNTFVLVHDITYIDKGERNENTAKGISVGGAILGGILTVAGALTDNSDLSDIGSLVSIGTQGIALVVENLEGFKVKVKTHLYRLHWTTNDSYYFYDNYYIDSLSFSNEKLASWNNANYNLKYIGSQEVVSGETVMKGIHSPEDVIKKVVYRALDECVVSLQKKYEEFKIKEPIYYINEQGYAVVKIGLKEGVSEKSKYEVLETRVDPNTGKSTYRKVGMLAPIKGEIWDNRYMAIEEGAENSELDGTVFKIVSGSNLYPGLLVREVKF